MTSRRRNKREGRRERRRKRGKMRGKTDENREERKEGRQGEKKEKDRLIYVIIQEKKKNLSIPQLTVPLTKLTNYSNFSLF